LRKGLLVVLGNVAVSALLLGLAEVVGQVYATLHPAYEVLYLEPDPAIGWKLVPGLAWLSTGSFWYARDFTVEVKDNALGFRDRERSEAKPPGVLRVAVLGDSFVQAVQVPLEKTATQLLEARLQAAPPAGFQAAEVLNLGVSNHGVGQGLLAWETYASRFAPDRVAIFVGGFHMRRTVARYQGSVIDPSQPELWVRPTFRLDGEVLVRAPAQDFARFAKAQRRAIERDFDGKRQKRRPREIFLAPYAQELGRLAGFAKASEESWRPIPADTVAINLRVIEELAGQVRAAGARLAIVDVMSYFEARDAPVSEALRLLCKQGGVDYIPLSERLLERNRAGEKTRWAHDGHFNEAGNRIFAEALFAWVKG
jgi:lysophospholipase L1-like esterase